MEGDTDMKCETKTVARKDSIRIGAFSMQKYL